MMLIKNFYAFILYMSDSGLQCNKLNSYWYGVQYQDRQTALGSWYGPVEMILPLPPATLYTYWLAIPEYAVYKYFIILKNIRLIVEWSPQNDKDQ
jgi:hypothetical protein